MQPDRRLSVVIATANRSEELCRTLGHLAALPERPPVIVVDNDSADGTPATVRREFPAVEVLALPANLGAGARTIGARAARGAYVAFCDDDSWWEPGSLTVAADRLDADPQMGLVAARVLVGPTADIDPVSAQMAAGDLDEWLRPGGTGDRGVTGFLACAAVVRRSAFLGIGGFDAHIGIGGEEELVALDLAAAGWKLTYLPDAVVRHFPSSIRDSRRRSRLLVRNHLLTTVLRGSRATMAHDLAGAAAAAVRGRGSWRGIGDALLSASWALSHRAPVPAPVAAVFKR